MENTEFRLLKQVKAGNEKAFKKIFHIYSDRLYTWSLSLTQDMAAAEDIVQDFFISYWEKREILSFNPSFNAYAYRSIYNASLNYLRDNKRLVYEITIDLADEDIDEEDVTELQRLLQKSIEELPERCKKVFIMATIERRKYTEVADLLGISVNTVKVQVSKAYRILRGKIG